MNESLVRAIRVAGYLWVLATAALAAVVLGATLLYRAQGATFGSAGDVAQFVLGLGGVALSFALGVAIVRWGDKRLGE